MMEPKTTSYAGMLDKSGFQQWYIYQQLRADHRFAPEEVSFLMGRPPFYFLDYAMLSSGGKLTPDDVHILAELFRGPQPKQIDFHKDDGFDAFEKRVIRVKQVDDGSKILSYITIPWTIKRNFLDLKARPHIFSGTKREINFRRPHADIALWLVN